MRIGFLLLVAWMLILVGAPPARADLWQGATNIPKRGMSIAAYGQVYEKSYSVPTAVMAIGQFIYGHSDQIQIETRLGFGMLNPYLGGFAKYQLLHDKSFALAVYGGMHYQNGFVLDGNLIGSYSVGILELYASPLFYLPFPAVTLGLGFTPGANVLITRALKIYLEFDLNLTGYFNAGSMGLRHFF